MRNEISIPTDISSVLTSVKNRNWDINLLKMIGLIWFHIIILSKVILMDEPVWNYNKIQLNMNHILLVFL